MRYIPLFLVAVLILSLTGCETVKGAANGMSKDMKNASNPSTNGWNKLQEADYWVKNNLW
jgi:hypothetical protein